MSDAGAAPTPPILELRGIQKRFVQGGAELVILNNASVTIRPGEMVALVGPSGAGKSTLLHIAGLLDRPNAGEIRLNGEDCGGLSDADRSRLRRHHLGFVYQHHYLLPEFSALENVIMPQLIAGMSYGKARERARKLLEALGLAARETHRPAKLSGGEQQRVALARAVANGPSLLLADEPTGNLDPNTAERVFEQLHTLVHVSGIGALVATHNFDLAHRMDRILRVQDGQIVEQSIV